MVAEQQFFILNCSFFILHLLNGMKNEQLRMKNEESGDSMSEAGPLGAAVKWIWRLFTKNTGLCELARGGIESDACPVPVS
jgi:hypothetical protein